MQGTERACLAAAAGQGSPCEGPPTLRGECGRTNVGRKHGRNTLHMTLVATRPTLLCKFLLRLVRPTWRHVQASVALIVHGSLGRQHALCALR